MSTGECPECEWSGDSRGLAGHRRFKHGVGAKQENDPGECPNCQRLTSELWMAQRDAAQQRPHRGERPGRSWRSPDRDAPPAQMPSVAEFVAHCEAGECGHATDWDNHRAQLLKSALDNASDDFLLSQVMSRELMPRISIDVPEVNGR